MANNVLDLRSKYNLPQNDDNKANMTWPVWKKMVKNTVKRFAFMTLFEKRIVNKNLLKEAFSPKGGAFNE